MVDALVLMKRPASEKQVTGSEPAALSRSHELDHLLLPVLVMRGIERAELELGAVGVDAHDDPAVGALGIEGVGDGGRLMSGRPVFSCFVFNQVCVWP